MRKKIREAVAYIRGRSNLRPTSGLILGTGLNNIAKIVTNAQSFDFSEIPYMPRSTAPSHKGRLIMGELSGRQVVVMQGRLHFYEGFSMQEITFPIRIMRELGVESIFITNAAGSLNQSMKPGELVLISDHINFMGTNPLIGENDPELGERFPSMHKPYDSELLQQAESIAETEKFKLLRGTYAAVSGPSLETRSECLMLRNMGADIVGMSTVPEVIVAIHSGMRVIAVSTVTNMTNIFHSQAHSQEDIRDNAEKSRRNLELLITKINANIE